MQYCTLKEKFKCKYITKENYSELLEENHPDYQNDYIQIEITEEGIKVEAYDMVHESKMYPFGWWVEEDTDYGYLNYGAYPEWNYYTDTEFENKFQLNDSDKNMLSPWVLCKDRLPDIKDCNYYDHSVEEHFSDFWVTILENSHGLTYSTKMCYRPERNLWYKDGSDLRMVENVVAWMPLIKPKPYLFNKEN